MSTFGALLDANVLFPAALCDTLLRAHAADLYRMFFSEMILEEVRRNLVKTGRTTEAQAERRIAAMRQYFPEAIVTRFERLIPAMSNHPKDRHVLAAAVAAHAQVIVTSNLRDFPETALDPFGIEAQSPDTFLLHLYDLHPPALEQLLREQAADLRNPPLTVMEVIDELAVHAPRFALKLRNRPLASEQRRCS
jgi:predicted nucleic acid-binding protein